MKNGYGPHENRPNHAGDIIDIMKDLSKNLGVPHFFNVDKQYKTTKGHIVPGGQKEQANGFKKYFEEKAHPTL